MDKPETLNAEQKLNNAKHQISHLQMGLFDEAMLLAHKQMQTTYDNDVVKAAMRDLLKNSTQNWSIQQDELIESLKNHKNKIENSISKHKQTHENINEFPKKAQEEAKKQVGETYQTPEEYELNTNAIKKNLDELNEKLEAAKNIKIDDLPINPEQHIIDALQKIADLKK